ncbi:MAG: AraC family transcriptional regulator [Bacteroidetes bacterium]|nr:AraC family transcriptional regulator [Bacteroidota bacterium]
MKKQVTQISDFCRIIRFQNDTDQPVIFTESVSKEYVQMHFVLREQGQLIYNQGSYQLDGTEDQVLLLFNTQKELPIELSLDPGGWVLSLLVTIEQLHGWFSSEASLIPFFEGASHDKKYYSQDEIRPALSIPLNQLMQFSLHHSVEALYFKAKVLEILALYFNRTEEADLERCPYLADDENVRKIRKAKDLLIAEMNEPPTLEVLAERISLPVGRLKEGFKQLYGDSVFGFLLDYKLDYARKLLLSQSYSVGEVAARVGYSTASHFIAAFKKKFGVTPKKYLADSSR